MTYGCCYVRSNGCCWWLVTGRAAVSAAAGLGGLNGTALVDLHFTGVVHRRAGRPDTVLDLCRHGHECLFHIDCVLGGRLKERYTQLISILLYIHTHDMLKLLSRLYNNVLLTLAVV